MRRDKVMRALKNIDSGQTIIDGLRAYYNFIRPHQALNDQTPAQRGNMDLELGNNKWLSMIRRGTFTQSQTMRKLYNSSD